MVYRMAQWKRFSIWLLQKNLQKKKMQSQLHFLFLPSESYRFFFEKHKKGKDKLNQNNLMLDYFL